MSSQHTVIVGGSSGIGLATARHLLASGARVTITGRNETRLVEARRQLGPQTQVVPMDASAADALPAQFAQIGKFDHLVLALGSGKGLGPFATASPADVKLGFEEKVYAHFATAQAALPFQNPTGSLTFVSGLSAHAAAPGTAGIGAANAAVAQARPDPRRRTQAAAGERRLPGRDRHALVGRLSCGTEAGDLQRLCRQDPGRPHRAARGRRPGDRLPDRR
jgi:NADP-dependent 3-hydroxy acid dehydrogenase YdfG